jgi:glycosyltransferase involved in cell wall biosynthesis
VSVSRPEVSVVIPVRDRAAGLSRCLSALVDQAGAPAFEVIVVDNGSRDDSAAVAGSHPAGARVLTELRRGPYAARNAGLAAARGRTIALTDADCLPTATWLAAGTAAIAAGADLVGGAIRQRATAGRPTRWERYDRATYLHQDHFVAGEHFAATANLFVRGEVVERVGPFRPELVASGDLEFGQRCHAAGFTLVYAAGAAVWHEPRTTLASTWRLHRKLGSGFAELRRAGLRAPWWRDESLRLPLGEVMDQIAADGPSLRRRQVAPVHALAMAGRLVGSITGHG